MNAFCQIRANNYVVDLGFISIKEAKDLAQIEANETSRTMVLWYHNHYFGRWESLSVHHPSQAPISVLTLNIRNHEN